MRRVVAFTVAAAFVVAACSSDGGGSVEAFCESVQEVEDNDVDPFETDSREDFVAELEKQRDAVNAALATAQRHVQEKLQGISLAGFGMPGPGGEGT